MKLKNYRMEHTHKICSPVCCLIVRLGKNPIARTRDKLGVMGLTWISWRTTVIIALLQTQALISVKTKVVTGVEGQSVDFICKYQDGQQNNVKFFSRVHLNGSSSHLVRTDGHETSAGNGRFSLHDNPNKNLFTATVNKLIPEDSGTYGCGVDVSSQPDEIHLIQLNVSRATTANPPENLTHYITALPHSPIAMAVDKLHLPLYLTAVMCVAAILSVCLFTLCLLLMVKHRKSRRSGRQHTRETSSDYETMMPGVSTEPECHCSCSDPDCPDRSSLPPPPPDLCSHLTSKPRDSTVSAGLSEYVDVDVSGHVCQYQHLDLSRLEEHVYHSLQGNSGPKDRPLGVKEHNDC